MYERTIENIRFYIEKLKIDEYNPEKRSKIITALEISIDSLEIQIKNILK